MKIGRFLLFFIAQFLVFPAFANTTSLDFMSAQDLMSKSTAASNDTSSNINLHNSGNTATTVYGLYIRQLAYVTPGESCAQATTIYSGSSNITAGSVLMPVVINAGKSAAVGKNYLYNMLFQASYYVGIIYPSSPPGCALPGCTWGSDTNVYNWCIYLGALAPVANSSGYTANVPPSTDAASNTGLYDYNLISNYMVLGPIACNDQTLTCSMATPQTQSFS